jgi:predicted site-specific integrase-resolvase
MHLRSARDRLYPMAGKYTLREAARELSVDFTTLRSWLVQAGALPATGTVDHRMRLLTQAQLDHLRAEHPRKRTGKSVDEAEAKLDALEGEMADLTRRVTALEQKVLPRRSQRGAEE